MDNSDKPTIVLPTGDGSEPGSASVPVPGKRWGRFLIEKTLGRGGQADVVQAFDQVGTAGHVALKVPHRSIPQDCIQQWIDCEVGTLSKLKHPNIVSVLDAGVVAGHPYVATALVDGLPMNEYVRTSPPSERQIADWLVALAEGLHEAHKRGVIHRDLKPNNVIVTPEGKPMLIDFGLASLVTAYQTQGRKDASGTFPFMAPEQARRDAQADHRVDVFGLGALLKYLLVGKGPYSGAESAMKAARAGKVWVISDAVGGSRARRALCKIANKALSPNARNRFQNMGEMADALRRTVSGRRLPVAAVAGALALAVVSAMLLGVFGGDGPAAGEPAGNEPPRVGPRPGPKPARAERLAMMIRSDSSGPFRNVFDGGAPPRTGDAVKLTVRFDEPMYACLFLARPGGEVDVLHPSDGSKPAAKRRIDWPADGASRSIDEKGMHMIVLLASKKRVAVNEQALQGMEAPGLRSGRMARGVLLIDSDGKLRRIGPDGRSVAIDTSAYGGDMKLFRWLDEMRQRWDVVQLAIVPVTGVRQGLPRDGERPTRRGPRP